MPRSASEELRSNAMAKSAEILNHDIRCEQLRAVLILNLMLIQESRDALIHIEILRRDPALKDNSYESYSTAVDGTDYSRQTQPHDTSFPTYHILGKQSDFKHERIHILKRMLLTGIWIGCAL